MEELIYTKYSNERSRRFALRTDILEEQGARFVRKTPLYPEGRAHAAAIADWYQSLSGRYAAVSLECNKCTREQESVRLEYVEAETLEEHLDGLLEKGKSGEAYDMLREYLEKVRAVCGGGEFVPSEDFRGVFGEEELPRGLTGSTGPVNIDMVCENLLLTQPPTVLDYEWSFDFSVPCEYVLYRVIHYYVDTHAPRAVLDSERLYEEFGIAPRLREHFARMEASFQKYLTGEHIPMREMFAKMTPGVGTVQMVSGGALQVFFSTGEGYREEQSVSLPMEEGRVDCELPLPRGCVSVRIDPGDQPCAVQVERLAFDGTEISLRKGLIERGCVVDDWAYIAKGDPSISELLVPAGASSLSLSLKTYASPAELMEQVEKKMEELEAQRSRLLAENRRQAGLIEDMKNTKVWKLYQKYRDMAERKK